MSGEVRQPPNAIAIGAAERSRKAQRATLVAMAVNLMLCVAQVAVGLFANAFSLVVDAAHTFSDLLTDAMVLVAARKGADPADANHPYGHDRIETVVSMALGLVLLGVGAGFLWSAGTRVQGAEALLPLHVAALWMALFTLAAKELLFRFMRAAGRRLDSRMLEANAWHARTDAASSLVVAVGIAGGLAGYRFVEPLAAALVGFMIARMGVRLALAALRELVDTAASAELVARIRETIAATPGVLGVHDLRTRRMAHRVLCDAHVQVDPRITVSEGHYVAEAVRRRVCHRHAQVDDVLVHVDVERDADRPELAYERLPDRVELLEMVRAALGEDVPAPARVLVHYLGGRVEMELFFPAQWLCVAERKAGLEARMRSGLDALPAVRCVHIHAMFAP